CTNIDGQVSRLTEGSRDKDVNVYAAPRIELVGDPQVRINANTVYDDGVGATCTNNFGELPVERFGQVLTNFDGTYTLRYVCEDPAGQIAQVTRVVQVSDNLPPVLTITGNRTDTTTVGATYVDPGAVCTDNVDGTYAATTTDVIDTGTAGRQRINYACNDEAGNGPVRDYREVLVLHGDYVAPEITIAGGTYELVYAGDEYVHSKATCFDAIDGRLDSRIMITGDPNTDVPARYTVTYRCTDDSGNTATLPKTVLVTADRTPPVLLRNGYEEVYVPVGSGYQDAGATCIDAMDGNIVPLVDATAVNHTVVAAYTVQISCTDRSENTATATRTVRVIPGRFADGSIPEIRVVDPATTRLLQGTPYVDPGDHCFDSANKRIDMMDRSITFGGQGRNSIDTSVLGTYLITYSCENQQGTAAPAVNNVRTVIVEVDTTVPVMLEMLRPQGGDPTVLPGGTYSAVSPVCATTEAGATTYMDPDTVIRNATSILEIEPSRQAFPGTAYMGPVHGITSDVPAVITAQYTCFAGTGDEETFERVVTFPGDTTPPEIRLPSRVYYIGSDEDGVPDPPHELASPYCRDDRVEGTFEPTYEGLGDENGRYDVTYVCTDPSGNTVNDTMTVVRGPDVPEAETPPRIYPKNLPAQKVVLGEELVPYPILCLHSELYVEIYDFDVELLSIDGEAVVPMVENVRDIERLVDTSVLGDYEIRYSCELSESSDTYTATIRVVEDTSLDRRAPVITVLGDLRIRTDGPIVDDLRQATCSDDVTARPALAADTSEVDINATGSYPVVYTCSDDAGFVTSAGGRAVVVDDFDPPRIVRYGGERSYVRADTPYSERGAYCVERGMSWDASISPELQGLTLFPGSGTVTYTCTDDVGNTGTSTRTVVAVRGDTPPDDAPPVVTVLGTSPTIPQGSTYEDAGATCRDELNLDIDIVTSRHSLRGSGMPSVPGAYIDTSVPGTYDIVYDCEDEAGNRASEDIFAARARVLTVAEPPRVNINGANPVRIFENATYVELGATCTGTAVQDGTAATITGRPDITVGTYNVTYTCTDTLDISSSKNRTVHVIDNTPPVITRDTGSIYYHEIDSPIREPGATCTDAGMELEIQRTGGPVAWDTRGDYPLVFSCTDAAGLSASADVEVRVREAIPADDTPPVVTVVPPTT
ncbi:MAG: DUF5011 domain-containing protein, partial [Nitrosopumilus sp.]|nr:DUF5011 domain-containing protein [Nitrosopumilus sp.]